MDPYWHIQLLGRLRVSREAQEITRFRTHKTSAMLACLAYHLQVGQTRDTLLEMLWSDMPMDAGRNSLSVALNSLRRQLEPPGLTQGAVLIADRFRIALNPEAVEVDAVVFIAAAQAAQQTDSTEKTIEILASAADRYGGPLLPDHYEPWVPEARDRLADLYLGLLRRLIKELAQVQEYERALDYAHRAVLADPLREEFHRSVMRLYVVLGRPASALNQFAELERRLREALDAEPSSGTRELAAQIAAGAGGPKGHASPRERHIEIAPQVQTSSTSQSEPVTRAEPTAPSRPHIDNLPPQFTHFFGRSVEMETLLSQLHPPVAEATPADVPAAATRLETLPDGYSALRTRLVTLTGPGGAGKTRLALEAAARVRDRFPGGVWFVPLADLNEARSLYMTIQQALALPHSRDIPPLEAIVAALSGRPSLLVLDNFEQLAASAADYVVTLLQRLPTLTLLITSRQALDLSGEQELGVLPLPVPRKVGTPERLLEFASVQMFVNRAQLRRQDFQITRRNAPMIVRLCEKLEGLPLAIELAAAWIRVLTPEQMVAQLERRLEFLVSRQSDLPERHRTLRAVMESSYRLLDPPLQAIFARLSVFRGGWTLEAAEFVCDVRALEALAQLQARSLIVAEEADIAHSETMRYRMLEAPAEYAAEQLPSEDRPFVAQRHTEYFLQLVEQARVPLAGPRPGVWLDRLESEMDNLRAALDRCQADPTGGATGLRFVRALFRYWIIRGRLIEGRERCIAALAHPGAQAADSLRASALFTVATLSYGLGDYAQARAFYEKSLTIREALQERAGIADILGNLGLILHEQGDLEAARPLYERTLALREEWNDDRGAARIRDCLSMILIAQGEFSKAREPLEASVALYTDLNDLVSLAHSLEQLGIVHSFDANTHEARTLHERSLALRRDLGDRRGIVSSLVNVATLACEMGDLPAARELVLESLQLCREMGERRLLACVLEAAGLLARTQRMPLRAAKLLGAGQALRHEIGAPLMPSERLAYDRELEGVRALIAPEEFEAAFREGQHLNLDVVAAELLEEAGSVLAS